jgi:AcrR family transcriptional regulator
MSTGALRTKDVILEAARVEFAAYGLAGGRVDRIAKAAGANVQRIYAYYGDKQGLFDAVVSSASRGLAEHLDPNPPDLEHLAAGLFDYVVGQPESTRTMTWARLEREREFFRMVDAHDGAATPTSLVSALQKAGRVDPGVSAGAIVEALIALSEAWHSGSSSDAANDVDDRKGLVLRFARSLAIDPAGR